jgi:predicted ester cyclase
LRRALEAWSSPERRAEYFDLYAPDAAVHVHELGSVAGLRLLYDALWAAFPDAKTSIEDLVADGDKLAYRITLHATHLGQFQDLAPTGKRIRLSMVGILHFVNGKVVGRWAYDNLAEALQQLRS